MPKITLNKEELALARERAKRRLPKRVSKSLRKDPLVNLPRMTLYPQFYSKEVQKLKQANKLKSKNFAQKKQGLE